MGSDVDVPICVRCGTRHTIRQPHDREGLVRRLKGTSAVGDVTKLAPVKVVDVTKPVTKPTDVTKPRGGRPRVYGNGAARVRAFRARQVGGAA